jgi:nucleoredoxin
MRPTIRLLALIAALLTGGAPRGMALPDEITVTATARFELMRGDKFSGAITLVAGEKLALLDTAGDYALVRYRNLNGRVPIDRTDLPRPEAVPPEAPPAVVAPVAVPVAPAPAPGKSHAPANALERSLAGKLVRLEGGALRPFDGARLAGVKFYALYYSASWCAPCREFTPGLVDAYQKIRELYPEFEVVLVNEDQSSGDMVRYMRDDKMAWPALKWEARAGAPDIMRYCGSGIPCLVLVDENGKVLSDTNRWGRYVGPDAVLDDTWKILRDYRRKNPRAKS